ncbi:methyl-accepting chemotaxis protein [Aliiruegeria haliotis]|uniref:Methyl-accepting chemotaxis protein n=1 Tax=Aliiruegeria haliotis TaxID=1280846 RepID=A0A2T0RPT4_9RHOB|nr:methyl-accepting chemotaxis protein [Aliiruegeria haliotis]PRY23204.1 methyl-accepting chemotaxis protein [Aliiruegeria haliotis]
MTPLKHRIDWSRWTIRSQINMAMGSVGVLLCLIAVVSVVLTKQVGSIFTEYREAAGLSVLSSDLRKDLTTVRLDALEFRSTASEESRTEMFAKLEELQFHLSESQEQYADNSELTEFFKTIASDLDDYRSHFEGATVLQDMRNELVVEISDLGPSAREKLSELMDVAQRRGDIEIGFAAGVVQQYLLQGRLHLERFLLQNLEEAFTESIGQLDKALNGSTELADELTIPAHAKLIQGALSDIIKYRSRADRIYHTIEQRNGFYQAMDEMGLKVEDALKSFEGETVDRQNTLGPAGSSGVKRAADAVEIMSLLSILVALVLAWRIGRTLSRNVRQSVATMSELAAGNLEVEVVGEGKANELGDMARALVVFRDNAKEARRLEAETEAANTREQERQKEQAEAERRAAEQDRQRAEEERRRLEELENFRQAVNRVIVKAAEGDFSPRVQAETGNEGLAQMAQSINEMLSNVDAGLTETGRVIREMADGNLTSRVTGSFHGAFAHLQADVNQTLETMNALIGQLSERGSSVDGKSSELQAAAVEMSRRSERNAASLEETSAALEEMSASVRQVAANVSQANTDAMTATQAAEAGASISRDAVTALSEINNASRKMESIAGIIEDIAFQINLLALNAGVESARAGDAGKGFAVVASEVRSLAQRSTESVAEISKVISSAREKIETGVASVGRTQETLDDIVEAVNRVGDQMQSVAESMNQQSSGISEINSAVSTLDSSTQANASASEEVTAASSVLKDDAQSLSRALSTFKVQDIATAASPKMASGRLSQAASVACNIGEARHG